MVMEHVSWVRGPGGSKHSNELAEDVSCICLTCWWNWLNIPIANTGFIDELVKLCWTYHLDISDSLAEFVQDVVCNLFFFNEGPKRHEAMCHAAANRMIFLCLSPCLLQSVDDERYGYKKQQQVCAVLQRMASNKNPKQSPNWSCGSGN